MIAHFFRRVISIDLKTKENKRGASELGLRVAFAEFCLLAHLKDAHSFGNCVFVVTGEALTVVRRLRHCVTQATAEKQQWRKGSCCMYAWC
jgi:hypothetical protein